MRLQLQCRYFLFLFFPLLSPCLPAGLTGINTLCVRLHLCLILSFFFFFLFFRSFLSVSSLAMQFKSLFAVAAVSGLAVANSMLAEFR